jgi:tetratricopeptide (TPR) repeat protein
MSWLSTTVHFVSAQYEISNDKAERSREGTMYYSAPMSEIKVKEAYNVGVRKLGQSKYKLAVNYFIVALRNNPEDLDAYYNMGVAYAKLKDYKNACNSFQSGKQHGDNGVQDMIQKYCR